MFQRLESVLQSEIRSLGHPPGSAAGVCRGGADLQPSGGAQAQRLALMSPPTASSRPQKAKDLEMDSS